jgi:hypothetical protein
MKVIKVQVTQSIYPCATGYYVDATVFHAGNGQPWTNSVTLKTFASLETALRVAAIYRAVYGIPSFNSIKGAI